MTKDASCLCKQCSPSKWGNAEITPRAKECNSYYGLKTTHAEEAREGPNAPFKFTVHFKKIGEQTTAKLLGGGQNNLGPRNFLFSNSSALNSFALVFLLSRKLSTPHFLLRSPPPPTNLAMQTTALARNTKNIRQPHFPRVVSEAV